ncbi:tetratricopeptide repeat protein [Cognatitamlana onchidii]|uniref:tetratricopeptide repeat protein n=1 Tax=Cognatitamlana onchidii TaxID=2562860 RepID=UPI0010A624CF|nr:multiheme c-type cytochrome [Algibacter onchidii]
MIKLKNSLKLLAISFLLVGCGKDKYQNSTTLSFHAGPSKYVGSKQCVSCHAEAYNTWKGSHHDLAMQIANDSTVLGDFNNVKTEIDGVKYTFYKTGSEYHVTITELDNTTQNYKISYAFGVTPLQQYLVDFEDGKKQVLRVTWDAIKKQWYHQYKGDRIQAHDWLHWTRGAQNWNTMCAECHSTNLIKNYDTDSDTFKTVYDEINVACESCHGPANNHINWANAAPQDSHTYILSGKGQEQQMNLCAPCHARRVKLTPNLKPGETFENQYMLQNITSNFYHGDGQINDEDYVFASFKQSKMFSEGVTCTDCHNAHSLKPKFEGNQLCTQCHVASTYDSKQHHFHEANTASSLCVNCHMTGKTYMGNDFRRDHSFRIPRPDQSEVYGTPNACTGCHQDKTDAWAAKTVVKWYGPERADHFSDALLVSNKSNISLDERKMLDYFINDLTYPTIARATVIENLPYYTQESFKSLNIALNDASPSVRYNALLKFRGLPPEIRRATAVKHMSDSIRLVRIGAAQIVMDMDLNQFDPKDVPGIEAAKGELENMLFSNTDFSTGRMQLGDYFMQTNDINNAIKHYEVALEMDSLLIPVYSNLATAYALNKEHGKAEETLDNWIKFEPEQGRPHYLKALLYFEMQKNDAAVAQLELAIRKNPKDTRSMYNLATYYYQENRDAKKAEFYINKALRLEPENKDFKYLLALIYKNLGQVKRGQAILDELRSTT